MAAFADGSGLYNNGGTRFNAYVGSPGLLTERGVTAADALLPLGFAQGAGAVENEYILGDSAVLFEGDYPLQVRDSRGCITPILDFGTEKVLKAFAEATGIYPGVAAEDHHAANLASSTTGMFVHPEILAGVAAAIASDYVYGQTAETVKSSWDNLRERFDRAEPTHPEHDMFYAFPSSWSDNGLVGQMRKSTAWEPEQYGYLQHLDQTAVLSMMQVVDVAEVLGRTLGPTQYLSESDSVEYSQAAHRIAGTILERQIVQWK